MKRYPRNLIGHFGNQQKISWPNNAKIAVQFVINFEEGGESCLLHGDQQSEAFLSEIIGAQPWNNQRHWNMESIYDYGARAGFWRLRDLFTKASIPVTVYGVATALARSPDQMLAMQKAGWEIASHGYKWIDYKDFKRADEAEQIKMAIELHRQVTGTSPKGWYTGRCSQNTVDLVCETGDFTYISDSYADDLPYWHIHKGKPNLIIPYTLDANDMRFAAPQGFNSGDQFFSYLRDSFDALYREGENGHPKMLSVGLHCRLIGRPGRIEALRRFIDYIQGHNNVWCPRRIDIANFWHQNYPCDTEEWLSRPSNMGRSSFIKKFADVVEGAPWLAEAAFELELGPAHDTLTGLHNAFCRAFRAASKEKKLALLISQPSFIDELSNIKTPRKIKGKSSFGSNNLKINEQVELFDLLDKYLSKFSYPLIIATRDLSNDILTKIIKERLINSEETEFCLACREIEKIAFLNLEKIV